MAKRQKNGFDAKESFGRLEERIIASADNLGALRVEVKEFRTGVMTELKKFDDIDARLDSVDRDVTTIKEWKRIVGIVLACVTTATIGVIVKNVLEK